MGGESVVHIAARETIRLYLIVQASKLTLKNLRRHNESLVSKSQLKGKQSTNMGANVTGIKVAGRNCLHM
jgi:hypothetical protein